jgi:hypothetical protein
MATLRSRGITVRLPTGFEGRIFQRKAVGDEVPRPVAQFATFPIPRGTADIGSGAVTKMSSTDVFVVLFEYGPESLGRALFARQSMPRRLDPGDFRPYTLRRGLGGQAGTQFFFTESGRPFTLYAVLGSLAARHSLTPVVNGLLSQIVVDPPAGGTAAFGAVHGPEIA